VLAPQGAGVTVVQPPAPLQTDAATDNPSVLQVAAAHVVVAPGYVQAVVVTPSQRPAQPAWVPVQPARVPRGAPATGVHMPTLFGSLQASHWPPQALPQQTPSTQ
jgi:hypothetical protein